MLIYPQSALTIAGTDNHQPDVTNVAAAYSTMIPDLDGLVAYAERLPEGGNMSEMYTAWDGNEYPMPPPEGWEMRADGRYWPATETPPAPSTPQPIPVPQPIPQAGPSNGGPSMAGPPGGPVGGPTAAPMGGPAGRPMGGPVGGPMGGPAAGPAVTPKKSNTGLIILLSIVGVIVLAVGGCVAAVAGFFNSASDAFEEFEESIEEFEENQLEARGEVSLTENGCLVVDGTPTATIKIANRSGGRSDYNVSVIFSDQTGRRLLEGFADVDSVNDGDDVLVDVESSELGVEGEINCDIGDVSRYSADIGTN